MGRVPNPVQTDAGKVFRCDVFESVRAPRVERQLDPRVELQQDSMRTPVKPCGYVVQREDADMGVFICLNDPTPDMRSEAASGGRIVLPAGERPRVQIVTAKELIAGPNLGILTELNTVHAAREARAVQRGTRPPKPDRKQRPLPPMAIAGGRMAPQIPLPMDEPLLAQAAERPTRRYRGK